MGQGHSRQNESLLSTHSRSRPCVFSKGKHGGRKSPPPPQLLGKESCRKHASAEEQPPILHLLRQMKRIWYHAHQAIAQNYIQNPDKCSTPLSHPLIIQEKGDIATLGSVVTGVSYQTYLEIPEDYTRNWLTHVSPATKGEHGVIALLHPSKQLPPATNQTSLFQEKPGNLCPT